MVNIYLTFDSRFKRTSKTTFRIDAIQKARTGVVLLYFVMSLTFCIKNGIQEKYEIYNKEGSKRGQMRFQSIGSQQHIFLLNLI